MSLKNFIKVIFFASFSGVTIQAPSVTVKLSAPDVMMILKQILIGEGSGLG